jgi:nucleotide-binding universal stress UspA family protein
MFKNILVPTDGSALSRKAIKAAVAFAQSLGAKVTGYYAVEMMQPYIFGDGYVIDKATVDQLDRQARAVGEKYLAEISKAAANAGVPYEGLITKPAAAYEGIIEAARKKKCDAIFMASHGRGELKSLLIGSVTQKVLSHSKLPVIVYR